MGGVIELGRRKPVTTCFKCGKDVENPKDPTKSIPGALLTFELKDPENIRPEYIAKQFGKYYQPNMHSRKWLICWECMLNVYLGVKDDARI